ncbi:MAG: hypothetical protein ACK558_00435 [Pseudomonadota bacterium]
MIRPLLLAISLCVAAVAAAAPTPEEVLRAELRATVARVMASGAFADRAPGEVALRLSLPAERYLDLGLLLDPRDPASDGLRVLGATPGGTAQALGVRAGDRLVAVGELNLVGLGVDEDGGSRAVAALQSAVGRMTDGERLSLSIERGGRRIAIDGAVTVRYLPPLRVELGEGDRVAALGTAASASSTAALATSTGTASAGASGEASGRISTFHVAPRSQRLYAARVLAIDGAIPGPADQDTFRLAPGRHVLEVAEAIDAQDLPLSISRRRAATGRRTLEVLVEPGSTQLVAARLLDTLGGRDYWEPVVWKTLSEACR